MSDSMGTSRHVSTNILKIYFLSQYNMGTVPQNPLDKREVLVDGLYFAFLNIYCSLIVNMV